MARRVLNDWETMLGELDEASDRATILIIGSLIDHALAEAICGRLRKNDSKSLFRDGGPANTLAQKITLAYSLKIIGPEARADLDLLRAIRNLAAHDMNPVTFQTDEIVKLIGKLRVDVGKDCPTIRENFRTTTTYFIAGLFMRASADDAEIAESIDHLSRALSD